MLAASTVYVFEVSKMIIVSVAYFLLLVSDATGIPRVNTTVGKSTILPCLMNTTITDLRNLRFYWQDENNKVLYSFDQGTEVPKYVDRLYRGRITAFHQDMRRGNVSIKLENTTMEDNQKVFDVFAKVFGTMEYGETNQICQLTLHVDAPNEIQTTTCPSNRSGAERSPPALAEALMVAAVLLWI
nr:CD276 antigen homolog [Pseudochaenichthys georgianus]